MTPARLTLTTNADGERIVTLAGDLDESLVDQLQGVANASREKCRRIDLGDLDECPAEGVARFCGWVMQRARSGELIQLVRPPQSVAHTLYRVGALQRYRREIVLIEPTTEEPYAG